MTARDSAEVIAGVLDRHFIMWRDLTDEDSPPGEWFCSCDAKFGFSYTAIRHVAAQLLAEGVGVLADAKAEVWDEGYARGRLVKHKPHGGPHRFHWCRLRWLSRRTERVRSAAWQDGYRFAVDHIEEPMVYADVAEYGTGWAGVLQTGITITADEIEGATP